jgi:hypothetical protein
MTTPAPPDLELLRKAIQEFRPNPHRVPFNNLKPFHDSIVELRNKNASYVAIADLLKQHGVKTSRARVAEYGRIVVEGGKSRKRRKWAKTAPVTNTLVTSQNAPTVAAKATLAAPAPIAAPAGDVPLPPVNSPYHSRGPRIANVRMMSPAEYEKFNASLMAEKAPKP